MSVKNNPYPIPKRYTDPTKLHLCDPRAKDFLRAWDGASGAAFFGPTKAGKSLAAGLGCLRVNKREGSDNWCKWVRADHLTWLVNQKNAGEQIHELEVARVLVIDEMGYEPWPTAVLGVIGDRHDHERPTIITCGLEMEAFAQRYADATIRRILEIGNGCLVDFWSQEKPRLEHPEQETRIVAPPVETPKPLEPRGNGRAINAAALFASVPNRDAPKQKPLTSADIDRELSKVSGGRR